MDITATYPPSIANPPCARLTKPINPMVTDNPTDTMNSTMPAARPPRRMPVRSIACRPFRPAAGPGRLRRAGTPLLAAPTDLELLAHVFHGGNDGEVLLVQPAVFLLELAQVLV